MSGDAEPVRTGGCHCGAVRFEVRLRDGLTRPRRCNCSICSAKGAVVVTAMKPDLLITQGADRLTTYRFNTGVAEHAFCSVCGVYTHHSRRSEPDELSVNVACLDGVSPFDFAAVPVGDGVHHTRDRGSRAPDVGVLRFERSPDALP